MKKYLLLIVFSISTAIIINARASETGTSKAKSQKSQEEHEDHRHDSESAETQHTHGEEENHDHETDEAKHEKDEKEHDHEHGHGHSEEGNDQVGPGKGIVSASEKEGIRISPEAEKNFEIKRIRVVSPSQLEIPKSAIVTAGTETNLFRYRNGHYKRIDFVFIKKSSQQILVSSKDLRSDDEIVVHGIGLLRIAEIAAFGGAPEGHSH